MRKKSREAIQWRKELGTWVGRIRLEDGSRTPWTRLGNAKDLAEKAYDRWFLSGQEPSAERGAETFASAAERLAEIEAGEDKAKDRKARLRDYALGSIGMLPVAELGAHHVLGVLKAMARAGKSASTVDKMRVDVSQVLELVKSEGTILVNVARSLPLPKGVTVDTRRRVSLSDAQVVQFHERHGYRTPLAMAALFSRQIAGHRTSDIHAGDWAHVDTVGFAFMHVRRPKTDGEVGQKTTIAKARKARAYEMVEHGIDEGLRPLVREYWLAMGSPKKGPIFPMLRDGVPGPVRRKDGSVVVRKAGKAGERKGEGTSYALPLRKAVWEAGIYDPMPGFDPSAPDPALCRFQTDTEETRRLDFQSFRRALVTAVADAQVPAATQLAITGHTQLSTQMKHYLQKRRVQVPKAALPSTAIAASKPEPVAPSPDTHALLAAMAAQTAQVAALSAQIAALSAGAAKAPAEASEPQRVGTNRSKPALRAIRGGR